MREGQFWSVRLSTSTYKSGMISSSGENTFIEFDKVVTENELRERLTGKLFYDWGYVEVSVDSAYEEIEKQYRELVKNHKWLIVDWLATMDKHKNKKVE